VAVNRRAVSAQSRRPCASVVATTGAGGGTLGGAEVVFAIGTSTSGPVVADATDGLDAGDGDFAAAEVATEVVAPAAFTGAAGTAAAVDGIKTLVDGIGARLAELLATLAGAGTADTAARALGASTPVSGAEETPLTTAALELAVAPGLFERWTTR